MKELGPTHLNMETRSKQKRCDVTGYRQRAVKASQWKGNFKALSAGQGGRHVGGIASGLNFGSC